LFWITAYYDGVRLIHGIGVIKGSVGKPKGTRGFGFDFVFTPDGYDKTYSEMTMEEKNKMSHRSIAVKNLFKQM
jgi:XTP/dITP diphosphohydrolase